MMAVGQYVAAARKRSGLTQIELGKLAGVDSNHISRIELGKVPTVMMSTLDRIAEVLGISVSDLLAGKTGKVRRHPSAAKTRRAS